MTTALTLYGSNIAASTLTTAGGIATSSGGTAASCSSKIGTSTGYGELYALSNSSSWAGASSLSAPSGNGWILDGTALVGSTLGAGSYSITLRVRFSDGSGVCDFYVRFYKYNSSSGIYTAIGSSSITGNSMTTLYSNLTFSSPSFAAMPFGTNDHLYFEVCPNITTNNTAVAAAVLFLTVSNSSSAGVGSQQITTPGYATSGTALNTTFVGAAVFSASFPLTLFSTISKSSNFTAGMVAGGTGLVVQIDGTPLFVEAGSLQVQLAIGKRSTASLIAHTDTTIHFQQYQSVSIYYNAVLIFSGYLSQIQESKTGFAPFLEHTLQAIDQHYLADKRIVAASYTNQTPGAIVRDLLLNYLSFEGVTEGLIVDNGLYPSPKLFPGPTLYPVSTLVQIPTVILNYCTVAAALDSLTAVANDNGTPYYWQIDQNKKLWFVPYTSVRNQTIIDGAQIEQKNNPPTVTRQNPTYRNKQYILGGVGQTISQTEQPVGDGNTTSWTMGYQIFSMQQISLNHVNQTFGIKGIDTNRDFYWAKGDAVVTQDAAQTKLVNTDVFSVTYIGQYDTVTVSFDQSLIAKEKALEGGNTTGIVESVLTDNTIQSQEAGFFYASNLLARYGQPGILLNFHTLQQGFWQGQLATVILPDFALNQQMLIESVEITDSVDNHNLWYTINAVSGPYDTTWVDFFAHLVERQVQAPISVGSSQTIALAVASTISLTPAITASVVLNTPPFPNTTLFPSPTLYP